MRISTIKPEFWSSESIANLIPCAHRSRTPEPNSTDERWR